MTAVQAERGSRNQTSIDEMSVHHRVRTPFGLEENKEDSQMRRSLSVAILLLFAAVSAGAAFAQSPVLKGEMAAAKIVVDEDKGEIALSAAKRKRRTGQNALQRPKSTTHRLLCH